MLELGHMVMGPTCGMVLAVPRTILVPAIFFFTFIGVYLVTFNTFDIFMMILFAVCALILRLLDYPMAPLLLGFILGGLIEDNLRRSRAIYDGSIRFLRERPLTIMITTILIVLAPFIGPFIRELLEKETAKKNRVERGLVSDGTDCKR